MVYNEYKLKFVSFVAVNPAILAGNKSLCQLD